MSKHKMSRSTKPKKSTVPTTTRPNSIPGSPVRSNRRNPPKRR